MLTTLGCKDTGVRNFKFVAKAQFLYEVKPRIRESIFKKNQNIRILFFVPNSLLIIQSLFLTFIVSFMQL